MKSEINTSSGSIKDILKYIVAKVNGIFLISLVVFIISFTVVVKIPLEQATQSIIPIIISRMFDVIGTISFFICFLFIGLGSGSASDNYRR